MPVTRQDAFEAPPLRPLRYLSGRVWQVRLKADTTSQARARAGARTRNYISRSVTAGARGPYERGGGGTLARCGVVVGTDPNTFMAAAIMPATSDTDAGTMTEVVLFARWPNCSTYCSATRS